MVHVIGALKAYDRTQTAKDGGGIKKTFSYTRLHKMCLINKSYFPPHGKQSVSKLQS